MENTGNLDYVRNKYISKKKKTENLENKFLSLELMDIYEIFLIVISGIILSLTILMIEKFIYSFRKYSTLRKSRLKKNNLRFQFEPKHKMKSKKMANPFHEQLLRY